jgi:hypothetical protein
MNQTTDVVLAGTKPFALALFAPLTERTGTRPRIAPDPAQALSLCASSSGLLVVEYGPAWLGALTQLRGQVTGLRIVAALPRGQESAALVLGPLGIEVVPWDGQAAQVVAAAVQLLGRGPPAAAPAAGAPAARPASPAPPAARPPAPPAPRPVAAPAAPSSQRPAVTPVVGLSPVARPPAASHPAPAAGPSRPPAAPPPAIASPPPPAAEEAPLDLFSDLGGSEATPVPGRSPSVDPFAPAAGQPERVAPPPYTGPPAAAEARPSVSWPASAPSEDEAEAALVLHLRGKLGADAPLAEATRQAVAAMSELERQVLSGAELPFDGRPVYRAAVLRLRMAVALASAPTPPAKVDEAAVQRLLAELDALLAEVNPLAQGAPAEHQPSLEAVRNALVREAVDFSEATHRVTAGGPPPAEAPARPAARDQASAARVLSVHAVDEQETRAERRRIGPIVMLVVVLLAGAGYHAHRLMTAVPPTPAKTFDGAPAGTRAMVTDNGTWLVAAAGVKVDPVQLEKFREQEARKGNVLREVSPGRWKIEAANPGGQGARP